MGKNDFRLVLAGAVILPIVSSILLYCYYPRKRRFSNVSVALPNKCHFLLGHAELLADQLEGTRQLCVEAGNEDGVSVFYILTESIFSVMKEEHIRTVLLSSNFRAKVPIIDKHFDMFLGKKALVTVMGDEWKLLRKLSSKAFNWEHLRSMVDDMTSVTMVFLHSLRSRDGEVLDMLQTLKCLTLDIIGKTGFGFDFACSESLVQSEVAMAFNFLLHNSGHRQFKQTLDPRAYFYSWPTESNRKFKACSKILRSTIGDLISTRRKLKQNNNSLRLQGLQEMDEHADLLKYLLDAHEEDGVRLDTDALEDVLLTIMFGGFDTSSVTLSYAFYLMTQHRDVEAKVVEEVRSVLGSTGLPSYDTLQSQLPYCMAVINEVLRLYPPAPLTVRTTTDELVLPATLAEGGATHIPKGVSIYIPIWWIHRSPLHFDDPESFDPDRFFVPERAARISRYSFLPFSGGARDCVGRRFAMLELVSAFALIMRAVSFDAVDGYCLEVHAGGVLQFPKHGMPLKVRARDL